MNNVEKQKSNTQSGFTLIELSIVLVIIGLLTGGILAGQELIRAAEIRSTVSQYEKYSTAINTFRNKYNAIPGDISLANAKNFGLCPPAGCPATAAAGLGDGNGLINDKSPTNNGAVEGESLAFWYQLSSVGLIGDALGRSMTNDYAFDLALSDRPGDYLPAAKLGKGNYWHIGTGNEDGSNYLMLMGVNGISAGVADTSYALTPTDAHSIDSKIDDAQPNTGTVQARQILATPAQMFAGLKDTPYANHGTFGVQQANASDICITGKDETDANPVDTGARYAMYNSSVASGRACTLRVRIN